MRTKLALSFLCLELAFVAINVTFRHYDLGGVWGLVLEISLYILIGLSAPLFLSRYFTRGIHNLNELAAVISRGDLTRKVEVQSNDEVGQLARSFNQMMASMLNIPPDDLSGGSLNSGGALAARVAGAGRLRNIGLLVVAAAAAGVAAVGVAGANSILAISRS